MTLPIVERTECARCCNTGITWREMERCDCQSGLNWEASSRRDELSEARKALLVEARRAGILADKLKQAVEALEAVDSEIALDGHLQEIVQEALETAKRRVCAKLGGDS
jgi:hypothetical protein